jgi:hypothetical protein
MDTSRVSCWLSVVGQGGRSKRLRPIINQLSGGLDFAGTALNFRPLLKPLQITAHCLECEANVRRVDRIDSIPPLKHTPMSKVAILWRDKGVRKLP